MAKDWTGNSHGVYVTLGASDHTNKEREEHDYYATDPIAIKVLLEDGKAELDKNVWECSCGEGHLSKELEKYGYTVRSTDLIDRGFGKGGVDFLQYNEPWDGDILTNPPYKQAQAFVEHALDLIPEGHRVYMFLKLQFLEGKGRRKLWERRELETLYVSSSRILCAKNGKFTNDGSAVAYGWYCFKKGYNNEPTIKWIN